ncbi:glycosyltransferase family 39 protein [Ignavibacterium sp.]|uniref:glycosyltransferase family 39 protein n=1 Tax=Ignavibacterium sp. TaxID=2651167 RepID=UPI0021FC4FAA|nr:glycosyltransferase family 39 protein [Ignavibacterium sp.]BDQ02774.1 MAG: hypothetical protein KatS3mg037_1349 [Ignavibacterium sp.]
MENQKKYLIIIFILALSLRILFFLFQRSWDSSVSEDKIIPMGTDQRGYNQLALNFIEHGKLSFKPDLPPVVLRTPFYPLFISTIYYTFGEKPWFVLLFQNVIDSLTAILIFFTITILFNNKTGFPAALLYAIEPHMILNSNTLYSDTLFVFLLSLFFYFFIKSIITAEKNDLTFGISATFLGLSVLVKPAGTYMFILVILILFYLYRKNLRVAIKKIILLYSYLFDDTKPLVNKKLYSLWRIFSFKFRGI